MAGEEHHVNEIKDSTDGTASIDIRYIGGFTARELLVHVAGSATDFEDAPTSKATAFEMLDLLGKPGLPSLTPEQVEAYVAIVGLICEYEDNVATGEPDEFSTEEERRAYAVAKNEDTLAYTVRWLGEQR